MSTLHVGGKKKKGGFAQLGDDDDDYGDDKGGNNLADFQSQLGQTPGSVRRPSNVLGGSGSGDHVPMAEAFSIGDEDDGFDLPSNMVAKSDDVEITL